MSEIRSSYWDNIKGVLICLVVFAHFIYDFTDLVVIDITVFLIYVFHMPAFVFVSGHFTHDPPKLKKLITAFVIFQSVYLILEFNLLGYIDVLAPAYVCWYLAALIVWRLIARYIPRKIWIFPILFVLSLLAGFLPEIGNRFGITRILAFLIFFTAGLFCNEESVKKIRSVINPIMGIVLLLSAVAGSFVAKIFFDYSKADMVMLEYSSLNMVVGRAVLIILAFIYIIAIIGIVPDKKSILTKLGKNSLPIFLIHRALTFLYSDIITKSGIADYRVILATGLAATVITLALTGNDVTAGFIDRLLSSSDKKYIKFRRAVTGVLLSFVVIIFVAVSVSDLIASEAAPVEGWTVNGETAVVEDPYYRLISQEQEQKIEDSVRIVFAGDLILLEDQVRLAYDPETDSYDFSEMFEYTADEISSADLAIGVYEGPSGGPELGYSTSNYGDGKYLRLNFPDEFAAAVADAGFDLVTTANNHILDSGLEAALRTNTVLDEAGLMHIGTYESDSDRQQNRVQIVEVSGMRIAVLAYTYGTNYHNEDEFFDGEYSALTSVITAPDSPYYEQSLQMVEEDFEYCRSLEPDLIIVLPHMGTQFALEADEFQTTWRQNFIDLGADIILGDHTHSVQPAFMEEVDGRMTFTAYCPGNYANVYREFDGDASMLVEVYVDPDTHEVIAGGIIPMWTTAQADGNYRPIPVWDIMTDDTLAGQLTVDDLNRVAEVHSLITGTVMSEELRLDMIEPDYLFDENGFMRRQCEQIEVTDEIASSEFFETVTTADSVCFIGDSITFGTKNGGVPWYEPMESYLEGEVLNLSYGGWTTLDILNNLDNIPAADVYVIAIGTNDVRYYDPSLGAVTADDYIANMEQIRQAISDKSPDGIVYYIAPWISFDGDMVSPLSIEEVNERREDYSAALENFASERNDRYIDPNPYIDNVVSRLPQSDYLLDWIHPNVRQGVALYSEAVIRSGY